MSLLGAGLGKGFDEGVSGYLQNVMQPVMQQKKQQQFQQDLFNKGFDSLSGIDKEQFSKMSPLEQLSTISKPFAAIPGGMDFLKTAYPELLKGVMSQQTPQAQMTASDLMNMARGNGGETVQPPYALGKSPQAQEAPKEKVSTLKSADKEAKSWLAQNRPDLVNQINKFSQFPTFQSPEKFGLSLDDEANLRQGLQQKGYRPEAIENAVESVRKDIGRQWQEAQTKYNIGKDFYQMRGEKWKDVEKTVEGNLPSMMSGYSPETADNLKSKLYQYAAEESPNLTPKQIYQNARAKLREDEKQLKKLAALPAIPPIRSGRNIVEASDRLKAISNAYQEPLKKGYEAALWDDAINNKKLGTEEAHVAIWGPQTSKESINSLKNLPSYPKDIKIGTGQFGVSTDRQFPQKREKYIEDLSNALMSIKPDDDLMVLRTVVLDKNAPPEDFALAIKLAEEKGLELSPFQQNMIGEIEQPRIRPLDELFSQPGKYIKWLFNYVTGKR